MARPGTALPDSFQSDWTKLVGGEFPYDATAFSFGNGRTRINVAAGTGAPSAAASDVRYALTVVCEGEQSQQAMRQKLAALERNFKALEH